MSCWFDLSFLSIYWISNFFGNLVEYKKEWWQGVLRRKKPFTWYSRPESSSFLLSLPMILPLIFYISLGFQAQSKSSPWSRSPFVWLRGYIYTQPISIMFWLQRYRYIHFSCLSKMHLPLKTHSFPLLHFIWISVTVIPRVVQVLNTRSSILFPLLPKYSF